MFGFRTLRPLPKALCVDELTALRSVPMNRRDRALITVMSGCGLRVSEACDLTLDDVHWSDDTPALRFTGKRGRERVVPMNLEVQDAVRSWLEARGTGAGHYVFCNLRNGERLSRKTVWAFLKRHARRAGIRHVHPHMLRHTFGTALADRDVPVERIRELMGHASIETSRIYITVSAAHKRSSVARIDRRHWVIRWFSRQRNRHYRFFGRPRRGQVFLSHLTVGRHDELEKLQENLDRGIDTLLIGPVGSGKSHLLAQLRGERIIRIRGLTPARQAIIAIAEALYDSGVLNLDVHDVASEDSEEGESPRTHPIHGEGALDDERRSDSEGEPEGDASGADMPASGFDRVKKQHVRTSVQGWTQMVLDSVEENEWALLVDDLSDLSRSTGRLVDRLNAKFVILAALHDVKPAYERHFWKFDRLGVDNLPPSDARRLIRHCAGGIDVEDYRMLETHVLQRSVGNPRAIIEIVARLRKGPAVTRSAVRDVAHTGARQKIDLTPTVIILAMALVAARFIARGMGSVDGYVIAGVGSALMMGVRFFFFRLKR